MNEADTQSFQDSQNDPGAQGAPSAGAQEHSIPKHRFDEVNQRAKALQEQVEMQQQLLQQLAQGRQGQGQPQAPQLRPEDLGVDPQLFEAAQKIAQHTLQSSLAPVMDTMRGQVGHLANKAEEQEFLLTHGLEKGKYLPRIRELRQEQAKRGLYLPTDIAYKLIRVEEMDQRPPRQAEPSANQNAPQSRMQADQNQSGYGYPGPELTRMQPTGGAVPRSGGRTASSEETLEEMEARLDGEISSKYGVI